MLNMLEGKFNQMFDQITTMDERVINLETHGEIKIGKLKREVDALKRHNEWLESQMPDRLREMRLRKENAEKEELLRRKGGILEILDIDYIEEYRRSKENLSRSNSPPIDA